MTETAPQGSDKSGVTRRTVVKGAAWAVPAIAVAGAMPAMAASQPPVYIDFGDSTACKLPGNAFGDYCYNKGYVLWAAFENTLAVDVTIQITAMTHQALEQCLVGIADPTISCNTAIPGNTVTVPAGQTKYVAIYSNSNVDSSGGEVKVFFTYTPFGGTPTPSSTAGFVTGSPWQGRSCTFPPGAVCKSGDAPLTACGTPCGSI